MGTVKMKNKLKLIIINTLICITLGLGMSVMPNPIHNATTTKHIEAPIKVPLLPVPFSFQDSVKHYIDSLNISHPTIVLKQAKIESGNFNSFVFIQNNNMFGMRLAKTRPTVAIGERYGYAIYENWQQSVVDYALLQAWSYRQLSRNEYLNKLGRSYAEDPNYVEKID